MISKFKTMIAEKLKNKEYRHKFFRGRLKDEVAMAIRDLREKRKMTQTQLAEACGMKQSAISRLENATYGKWGIDTLLRISKALDARLVVALLPMEDVIEQYQGKKKENANNMEIPYYDLPSEDLRIQPKTVFNEIENPSYTGRA